MVANLQALHSADSPLPFVLTVDSLGLHATINAVHEGKDYRLRRLRDSFETGEITVIQWIAGHKNIADRLTKRNTAIYKPLNSICIKGTIKKERFKVSWPSISRI